MKKTSAILILFIFLMSIWIKNLYDDIYWLKLDSNIHLIEDSNEVNTIRILNNKIDSLEKLNIKDIEKPKEKRKKIINKNIDSLVVIKSVTIDTINLK
jgi:hypothetical protein